MALELRILSWMVNLGPKVCCLLELPVFIRGLNTQVEGQSCGI